MRVWEEAPFHEGDELPSARWDEILARTNRIRARGQALALLARTEHSRFLLSRKLLQRGHEPQVIDAVLDELEAAGSLSDERFAEGWVRGRLRSHPEGRSHLLAGLRTRGVDGALAESAIDRVLREGERSMVEAARSYAERLTRRRALDARALADRLYRRGFAGTVVRTVVGELDPGDATGEEWPE